MTMPAGSQRKTKDNSKKNYRANEEWRTKKKQGRPAQQYNISTHEWSKIMEPKTCRYRDTTSVRTESVLEGSRQRPDFVSH